jgi:hypothetical protein
MQGTRSVTSDTAGLVPRAVELILHHLSIVPQDRFMLTASLSGDLCHFQPERIPKHLLRLKRMLEG